MCRHQLVVFQLATLSMKLQQMVFFIPSSTAICEMRFSKRTTNLNHLQALLDGLDVLTRMSILCKIKLKNLNWRVVFEVWNNIKI
jgi:hypothetical protein